MSEDMKEIYHAYAKTINPSEPYKAKLIQRMEQEKKARTKRGLSYGVLAAGVCLAAGVTLFVYGGRQQADTKHGGSAWEMGGSALQSDGYRIQKIPASEVDDDGLDLSDAQWIPGVLAKKMYDTLLVLEYDSDSDFLHSKIADRDMVETLCREIVTAKETRTVPDTVSEGVECVYYRALFCDGSVISFYVADETELIIEDMDCVYHMQNN